VAISPTAYRIAERWSGFRKHPAPAFKRDIAEQVQDHLNHGADPDYLVRLCWWMATEQPGWFDLSLAMQMSGAPQPTPSSAPGRRTTHRCPCRAVLTTAA
jgi:hypothetical protein